MTRDAGAKGCGFAVAVLLVLGTMWMFKACGESTPPNPNGSAFDAEAACEQFVKARLKAPSTADVNVIKPTADLGAGKWRVSGYYDAQNSFGAKLRGYYVCDVQHTTETNYTLTSMAIK